MRIMTAAAQRKAVADSMVGFSDLPVAWLNNEADLIRLTRDDLDGDVGCHGNPFAPIPGIGKDLCDERKWSPRGMQDRAGAVTILDTGGMREQNQGTAVGIDQRMALAALDFLAGIITTGSTTFAGFDALAVDGGGRW